MASRPMNDKGISSMSLVGSKYNISFETDNRDIVEQYLGIQNLPEYEAVTIDLNTLVKMAEIESQENKKIISEIVSDTILNNGDTEFILMIFTEF